MSSVRSASLRPFPRAPGSWPPCPASITIRATPRPSWRASENPPRVFTAGTAGGGASGAGDDGAARIAAAAAARAATARSGTGRDAAGRTRAGGVGGDGSATATNGPDGTGESAAIAAAGAGTGAEGDNTGVAAIGAAGTGVAIAASAGLAAGRAAGGGARRASGDALDVDDDAIRVVERVDAVPAAVVEIEHDAGGRARLRADAYPAHDVVGKGQHRGLERGNGAGAGQIHEHAIGTGNPLAVVGHLAIELDRHAHRVGQALAPHGGQRDQRRLARRAGGGRWSARHRRRTGLACTGVDRGRRRPRGGRAAGGEGSRRRGWCRGRRRPGLLQPVLERRGLTGVGAAGKALRQRREQAQRPIAIQLVAELQEQVGREIGALPQRLVGLAARREEPRQILEGTDERAHPLLDRGGGARACARPVRAAAAASRADASLNSAAWSADCAGAAAAPAAPSRAARTAASDASADVHRSRRSSCDRPALRGPCRRRRPRPGRRPPSCRRAGRRG